MVINRLCNRDVGALAGRHRSFVAGYAWFSEHLSWGLAQRARDVLDNIQSGTCPGRLDLGYVLLADASYRRDLTLRVALLLAKAPDVGAKYAAQLSRFGVFRRLGHSSRSIPEVSYRNDKVRIRQWRDSWTFVSPLACQRSCYAELATFVPYREVLSESYRSA